MVDVVRRALKEQPAAFGKTFGEPKVGHAGTLDPFAEGVLIILVGREATRRQREFMGLLKTYVATLKLGETSDTDDPTGNITNLTNLTKHKPSIEEIKKTLNEFIGDIEQTPPTYSAVKLQGKKAYDIARRGGQPMLKPKTVHIESIKVTRYDWPFLEIEVACGSGTYIRALARDIGEKLGCGAYVVKLTRTRIGPYSIEDAIHEKDLLPH